MRIIGEGKVVVFLHGFLLDSTNWIDFHLDPTQFQSVFIDLPGHGENKEVFLEEETIGAYAKWVHEQLTKANILEYDLIGHSMGGYIGLELIELNSKMGKLILFHSNHWEDSEERKKNRDRIGQVVRKNSSIFLNESIPLLFHEPDKHENSIKEIVERAKQMSPSQIVHAAQSMKNRVDLASRVKQYAHKCYFIQGENDKLIDAKEAKATWAGDKNKFIEIKNCGHMSHIEQRTQSAECILKIVVDD